MFTSKEEEPATFKLNATARGAAPETGLAEQLAVRLGDVLWSLQPASPTESARPITVREWRRALIAPESMGSLGSSASGRLMT